ncbi:MAG TPA: hypothetical protein VE224_06810 [Pseudolabrys sp.]|nr:hypothetical protein [Pseudolabrys sp.]
MSEGQKTFWLSAAFIVVIVIGGVTLWQVMTGPTAEDIAVLNAKIQETNTKLAQVQKTAATAPLMRGLDDLQDNLKSTNAALANIQQTIAALQKAQPAAGLGEKVAAVESEIKNLSGKIASVPSAAALKSVTDQVGQIDASLKNADVTLAAIKQAMPKQNLADQIDPLNDKIKSLNDTLSAIQKSTSLDGVKKQLAALNSKLEKTGKAAPGEHKAGSGTLEAEVDQLKTSVAEIAKLKDALKPPPKEAVVFYLRMPNEKNLPEKIAAVQPLDIQFQKIGSTDDNGQAAIIIPKLKTLLEGRKGCSISVAGFADTLGSDSLNLHISQKRAQNIAQKIKAAFPDVTVNTAAWGERRLQKWTPDATPNPNNRRVDIAVNCKN